MKKILCALLALVMILAMAACGGQPEEVAEVDPNKETYDQAMAAFKDGDYETAYNLLSSLGDYEDAAQTLALIKVSKTGVIIDDGSVVKTSEYVFQKDGLLIKENITLDDGTIVKNYYKYNHKGQCTSETLNNADGTKLVNNHFFEDDVKVKTIRTNADKSKDVFEYTYDEAGKLVEHTLTMANGDVHVSTYVYNDKGQLTDIRSTGLDAATTITAYEFNEFGDKVKETVTTNDSAVSVTTYTYKYAYTLAE